MNPTPNQKLSRSIIKAVSAAAVFSCFALQAPATLATTVVTFSRYLEDDGNPGTGAAFDRLEAPWSESIAFNQFSIAGKQLNAVSISYSLFAEISQDVTNNSRRNAGTFSFQNTLSGGLSLGGTTIIDLPAATKVNTVTLPLGGSSTFPAFDFLASGSVMLTGAAILPFIGTGTISLTSFADALSTPLAGQNYTLHSTADGNATVSVDFIYSEISRTPVPEAGSSLPLLSLSCAGIFLVGARRRSPGQ